MRPATSCKVETQKQAKKFEVFCGSEVHKQTAIVRVPETLTNSNSMCTLAGIAETYEAKHAWLGIRPRSYNDTLTLTRREKNDTAGIFCV